MKLCKMLAVPVVLYLLRSSMINEQAIRRMLATVINFLNSVSGCRPIRVEESLQTSVVTLTVILDEHWNKR